MRWNVAQILRSPIGATRQYVFEEESSSLKELAAGITGSVRFMRTDVGILVTAQAKTAIWCTCSRCLVRFVEPVDVKIEEVFYSVVDPSSRARARQREESGFLIDARHVLDLTEPIRQYGLLQVPMKPLCGPTCAGLCVTCGVNLNKVSCECPKQHADPRWAGLEKVRTKLGAN